MAKYQIHAFIKTVSPLHIASPGQLYFNPSTQQTAYKSKYREEDEKGDEFGPLKSNIPCIGIQRLDVLGEGGKKASVPVIPANNLMGHLRRHAAELVLDALAARGERVDVLTFNALTCGAATGKPDAREVSFAEYRQTRAHPYIGLFGGGPKMMRRHVKAMNAVPLTKDTRNMFVEGQSHSLLDLHEMPEKVRLTQAWHFRRNDDLLEMVNIGLASRSIEDFENKVNERQNAILAEKAKAKEDEGGRSSTSTFSFAALEFVLPGVTFPVSWRLDLVNDAQLGLFLSVLDRFARIDTLGGADRNGFGRFSLNEVQLVDENGRAILKGGALDLNAPEIKCYIDAWSTVSKEMTGAALNQLLMPAPVKEKKPKKGNAEVAAV